MNLGTQREILLARRRELFGQMQALERALDTEVPRDFEDRSSERQGDEVLEALGHAEELEVRRVDAALERVRNGTYGTCQTCGGPISDERLAVLPDTAICRECAFQG